MYIQDTLFAVQRIPTVKWFRCSWVFYVVTVLNSDGCNQCSHQDLTAKELNLVTLVLPIISRALRLMTEIPLL